jgi:hypothetical protein
MSHPFAFVLLAAPVPLNESTLVETLQQRHPERSWAASGHAARTNADDPVTIRCGDHLIVVMSMPAPIPHDENLWKRASRIWPQAPEVAGRHRAHLIVSTMGAAENRADIPRLTQIESARLTTAVVGALTAATTGCCAVVWDGKVARSAQMWLDTSRSAFAPWPDHPCALWIDIVPYPSGRAIRAVTVGLFAFVYREIEFEVDGMDRATVIQRVAGIAFYLIQHGFRGVIKDGTVLEGDSAADRVKARARISRFTRSPVLAFGPEHEMSSGLKSYPIIPLSVARDHPLLIMLRKAGLFDASSPENQIQLWPEHYVSEVRLENYDSGMNGVFWKILATDAYADADQKARSALAGGDVDTAKSVLMPFAKEVREFLASARVALSNGDLHMFLPKPLPAS